MKKTAMLLALIFVLSAVFTACAPAAPAETQPAAGGNEPAATQSTAPADAEPLQVAYVSSVLTNEIFAMQVEAMDKYCAEIGVEFLNTPCQDDAAKISAIENYTQAGVDVIIAHVTTAAALEDPMRQAQAAGIKFLAYDTAIPGCDAFFGLDNFEYGYAIGKNAVDWINANFTADETCYCYSANYPAADFLAIRETGYIAAINELAACKIEWAGEGLGGATVNGVTTGENWLQNGKPINCVVGINDAGCLGVYEAFAAAGKLGDEKLGIFAGDATGDAIETMMEEGSIFRGTVQIGLAESAPAFIDICVDLASGGEGSYNYCGTWFITPENVAAYAVANDVTTLTQYSEIRSEPIPAE